MTSIAFFSYLGQPQIYLLDDGKRKEFQDFAQSLGIGYITRTDNRHAKAGNLNHALTHTDGDLIAVFDCDHVPNRAFLQMTIGWFVKDTKMSVIQTPHHFYSRDPFERNLSVGQRLPNEGLLFYGLIQDCNDVWNASFFCGSCAVIRRSALESIGGFAVETVTEDAHTAMRLHRNGWRSGYLRLPLAAGLATERLAIHIGQRMRWARGMTQIFRLDNPFLGKGLSIWQRICYANAMLHFFFALPRFVFLTAPLVFLLFQKSIIVASAWMILAYAGPHLIHTTITNSRVQGRYRHSFWAEVYESAIAFSLIKPTLLTLVNPRAGKFNVTQKGGRVEESFFDTSMVKAQLFISALLLIGIGMGLYRILFVPNTPDVLTTHLINVGWASFNLLTLLATLAVGLESREMRGQARIDVFLPASVYLPDGRVLMAQTTNLSMGGAALDVPRPVDFETMSGGLEIELPCGSGQAIFPAQLVEWRGDKLRIRFDIANMEQRRELVKSVLGRADAWLDWDQVPADLPIRSFGEVLTAIGGLLGWVVSRNHPRSNQKTPATKKRVAKKQIESETGMRKTPRLSAVLVLAGLMASFAAMTPARSQDSLDDMQPLAMPNQPALSADSAVSVPVPTRVTQPAPQADVRGTPMPLETSNEDSGTPPETLPPVRVTTPENTRVYKAEITNQTSSDAGLRVNVASTPQERVMEPSAAMTGTGAGTAVATAAAAAPPADVLSKTYTLADLGLEGGLPMSTIFSERAIPVAIRADQVVTSATLNLNLNHSTGLLPEVSNITVLLNDETVGTIWLDPAKGTSVSAAIPLPSYLFKSDNVFKIQFRGHYRLECEDPLYNTLWAKIEPSTNLVVNLARLPLEKDLKLLPQPFFDSAERKELVLPFVLPRNAANLGEATAIAASYWGAVADWRGARFPTSFDTVPNGNVVAFGTPQEWPADVPQIDINGPTLALVDNPRSAGDWILIVAGKNASEVRTAATVLGFGATGYSGASAVVQAPELSPREPYDAPRWIPTDRKVTFGEIGVTPLELQGRGLKPGLLGVPFRTAPDLFVWGMDGVPMEVRYRHSTGPWLDYKTSKLEAFMNNSFVDSLPLDTNSFNQRIRLVTDGSIENMVARLNIPPYLIYGQNRIEFLYDLFPLKTGQCIDNVPEDVSSLIDPSSTVDFRKVYRFTAMPNLGFMTNSGFPFTRMADLSQTLVVLPAQPGTADFEAMFGVMGMFGANTGYPVTGVEVANGSPAGAEGKDVLFIGTFASQNGLQGWSKNAPVQVGTNGQVSIGRGIRRFYTVLDRPERNKDAIDRIITSAAPDISGLMSFESPVTAKRTVVAVMAAQPQGLLDAVSAMRSKRISQMIQGDLALLDGKDAVQSDRIHTGYFVGKLPLPIWLRWYFQDKPLILVAMLLVGVLLLAVAIHWTMKRLTRRRLAS